MDIAEWLRGLGLERYTQAFQDAEVTPEILSELTDADLRELGLPLGPRKTVLKAIYAHGSSHAPVPVEARASAIGRKSAIERKVALPSDADRRQLTVMFVDLVGSTALASGRDPEEVRDLMQA
ncbi:adenylate cyclase, partial [Bradyrhizobium sp. SSUT112]|nr:adenylate cyclase [Bradyrhizobium sp. SSUT112]